MGSFQRARTAVQQQQRRDAILSAARTMLERLPPDEVSLRELSRQVGLAKSNVVRYFPTREAVFLAVLSEDWAAWLGAVERRLPRRATRHDRVARVVAETLAEHRRFCNLLAACQTVLERNVPIETARTFKTESLGRLTRLADAVRSRTDRIGERESFEFAALVWVLVAGAWPMTNPSPAVAAVLAEPGLAALRVDFVPAMTRALTALLDGLATGPA